MEEGNPKPSSTSPTFFSRFLKQPFDVVDNLSLNYLGIEWNFIKRAKDLRRVVFLLSHVIMVMWFLLGFDSSQSQLEFVIVELPAFFQGKVSWGDLAFIYQDQYGKGMHYSAWVIYGFMFWGLSKYYDKKLNLKGSRNFALSFAWVLLSIGVFETFWHYSFAIFQNQPWILLLKIPQIKILIQNWGFFLLGFMMILVMYVSGAFISLGKMKVYDKIKPFKLYYPSRDGGLLYWKPITNFPPGLRINFGKWTWITLILTLSSILVWYNYGQIFPVEQLEVPVITNQGNVTWTSSPYFPQTVYTIETDITDEINAGVQFYVENDLLHGVNTLCKIFMTLTFFSMGRVRRRSPNTMKGFGDWGSEYEIQLE